MWQHNIDTRLEEACQAAPMPDSLTLPATLRAVCESFNEAIGDPRTFDLVKIVTAWALSAIMDIVKERDELADRQLLARLTPLQTNAKVKLKEISTVHTLLWLRARNHLSSSDPNYYRLGRVMAATALLLEELYPLGDARQLKTDVLDIVVWTAVIAHVHREWCGPETSEEATVHLVDKLSAL